MRPSLVTGGCGFIGQHLVRLLVARGEKVRVLDRRRPAPGSLAFAGVPREGIEFRQADITDPAAVDAAMTGVGRVYHLAADPNLWALDKSTFERVNLGGTLNVLAAAERHRAERVVYTSTESILAGLRGAVSGGMIDESAALRVEDMPGPYCRSKFLAERAALDAAARGLPVVVVNPTLPIGPGDRLLTPPSRMLLDFLTGRTPAYLETAFNMIDVRDVALGHLLAAEHGRVGRRYILGGDNLTMSSLLGLLTDLSGMAMPRRRIPYWLAYAYSAADEFIADRLTGKPPRAPLTGVRLARHAMHFDNSRALSELGLQPRPLRHSLADAIAWFRAEGLLPSPASPCGAHPQARAGE
ncbi:NAD-dependent epimerase/dehydratase family protein [Pelagibius sp. 7325]|uniref:NAD-dependent epimerase/dehydratase family protein n=1 Tax=Pelagibius sp. 7325 TaxID=3131994 RepID=UPI0030EF4582